MGKYFFQVALAFLFWGSVIWFGLPILKDRAPGMYGFLTSSDRNIEKIFSDFVEKAEQTLQAVGPSNAVSDTTIIDLGKSQSTPDKQTQEADRDSQLMAISATNSGVEVSRSGSELKHPLPENDPIPIVIEEPVVEEDLLAALNKDPGYGWGLVVTNSFVYDSEMKRIGIFSGGTIVSCKESDLKMNGYVSECFYLKDRQWVYETVFIYEADLIKFNVTYEEADAEQRNLLIKYCKMFAELEEKRAEARRKAIRRNPHFNSYKTAMETYNEFFQKVKVAKEALEHAVGMERTRLLDELRKYRAEQAAIISQYKETKKQYDAWKDTHIGNDKNPKVARTVDIQNLERALELMRPTVQQIVPGL